MRRIPGTRPLTRCLRMACLAAACLLLAAPAGAKARAPTHPFRSYPAWAQRKEAAWVCDVGGTHGVCGLGKVAKVKNAGLRQSSAEGRARTAIARFVEAHSPPGTTRLDPRVVQYWDDGRRRAAAMVFAPVSR